MANYTKNLRTRADIMGDKRGGFCVICGTKGKLTADHVPPKGCIEIEDVILGTLMPDKSRGGRNPIIQGGVKFKTICAECNNELLGTQYDPALKDFINDVLDQFRQRQGRIALSPIMHINFKSNRVARSLIGHMLAAHSVPETIKKMDSLGAGESLRQYLLNPNAEFPDDWRLYCWPYLSRHQIILRHGMLADFSVRDGKNNLYGHIIKFFPLGFWFVHEQPKTCNIYAYEITPHTGSGIDDSDSIFLDIRNIPSQGFPETPIENQVMLFAEKQVSVASPKPVKPAP